MTWAVVEIEEGLKLPAKISEIQTTRSKLRDAIFALKASDGLNRTGDLVFVSELFKRLIEAFPKRCRESSLFREALHRSIENFVVGTEVGMGRVLDGMACSLSGNILTLLKGHPLSSPTSLNENDYCLAIIRSVEMTGDDEEKYVVSFEFMTGENASDTKTVSFVLYETMIKSLMKPLGLIRKFAPRYERKHPRHLVGCFCFIKPSETDGYSRIEKMGSSSALKSKNKVLSEQRVFKNRNDWCDLPECGLCPKGPEECHLSTRTASCVNGLCPITNELGKLNPNNSDEPSLEYQELFW